MNGFKKILIWTLLPIAIDCLGLLFIDKVYLNATTTFNPQKIDISSIKKVAKINVKVPQDAKQIMASYNGKYISYIDGDAVCVVDTSNNKKKELKAPDGGKISLCKWSGDQNIMLMGEKYVEDGSSYFKFESYDAKKGVKNLLSYKSQEDEPEKELKMTLMDEAYDIKDMSDSSATGVTYIWIGKEGKQNRVFHINRMIQKEEVKIGSCMLGNIEAVNKDDKLIYEDRGGNRIRVTGRKDPIATGENASHYLLGVDGEDMVYIGNGDSGKVNKIFGVNLKKGKDSWKIKSLGSSVDKNDIYTCRNGNVYINYKEKGIVKEFSSDKELKYPGNLIGVYNFGVISNNNGKIVGTFFEE